MSLDDFEIKLVKTNKDAKNPSEIHINGITCELNKEDPSKDKNKMAPSEFWDQNLIYMVIRDHIKELDKSNKMIKSIQKQDFQGPFDPAFFFDPAAKAGLFFSPGSTTKELFEALKKIATSLYEQVTPKIKFGTVLYFASITWLPKWDSPGVALYTGVRESDSWSHYTEPEIMDSF